MEKQKYIRPYKLVSALALVTICTGCINPADYETTPVQVSTPEGVVTCQLYRPNQIYWDRATDAPMGMTIKTADQICIDEAIRLKNAS